MLMLRPSITFCWLTLLLTLATGLSFYAAATTLGQGDMSSPSPVAIDVLDLQQQLEKGLRVKRPEDLKFVKLVVTMVGNNTLPLPLVKSAFLWARKKALTTPYPFPYFERALRVLAAKQGITIP